jgi:putative restriction endonuclease
MDNLIRNAAFSAIRELMMTRSHLTSADLAAGFVFEGQRIPFRNPQQGIFKPKQMQWLLSIQTIFPKTGRRVWYDDQRHVHQQIYDGHEIIDYAFMGTNPDALNNRWLREAMENRVPIIYFLGIAPTIFEPVFPAYIATWDAVGLKAGVAFGLDQESNMDMPTETIEPILERRYALRQVKQRLHQATFREAVITAYDNRCALSGLPEPLLIDAAHIMSDKDERWGQPVVPNGLTLSKVHHAAFDSHLIGIDPDFRIHVSEKLLIQNDGPLLESIKQLNRQPIHLPKRKQDHPDRDRLAQRFEIFKKVA